jgi:RNA polymerase sigma-70 factor, ECF subfamily
MPDAVDTVLTKVAREESGRVLALLARRFNDVDLADESVQDALVEASTAWRTNGVPDNPAAWLHTVARRKALDRMRRRSSALRRTKAAAHDIVAMSTYETPEHSALVDESPELPNPGDEQLRLIFLCCHPALDQDAQIALTLRMVGGLTTPEIASAFLVPEATLAQRIVRAKRKIRDANIPLAMPEDITTRLAAVLAVLYLIFNEGYLTRSDSGDVLRVDLAAEALRLTRLLQTLTPNQAEVLGLLALEYFHLSRFATRADGNGDIVLLDDQDRTQWDHKLISEGNALMALAFRLLQPGPLQVQAVIAAHHANARTATDTNWPAIAAAYEHLMQMNPSPVVALNRAVAIAMADGPYAGLALLDGLADTLHTYHLFYAVKAELLLRAGQPREAGVEFQRARELTLNPAEQRHLDRRLAHLV